MFGQAPLEPLDYLRPLFRRKWLILAIVVVATAATYAFYALKDKTYVATTKVLVQANALAVGQNSSSTPNRTLQDQAALLRTRDVTTQVARLLGRPGQARELANSIDASASSDSDFVFITATRHSAKDAARVANAFAQAFIRLNSTSQRSVIQRAIADTQTQLNQLPRTPDNSAERSSLADTLRQLRVTLATTSGSATQVDPALPPGSPTAPHTVRNTVLALVLSLIGAAALAYVLETFDRRPRRIDEFERLYGMPVLAVVPPSPEGAFRDNGQPALSPAFREPFRQLRTNVHLAALDRPFRRILVTSAIPGEGKSTVVRNLALVLREGGLRVAVVDTDMRRPALPQFFNLQPQAGLTDVLTGKRPLDDALVPVPVQAEAMATVAETGPASTAQATATTNGPAPNGQIISLLASGPQPADPQAVLAADRTRGLLDAVAQRHDVVLLDSPPLLRVSDAVTLATQVDAVIVVARFGQVTRGEARRLAQTLARAPGTHPVGVVVNDVPSTEGYAYGE